MGAKALLYLSLICLTLVAPITPIAVEKENSAVEHSYDKNNFAESGQAADVAIAHQAGALEWFKATVPLLQALVWPAAAVIIVVVFKPQIGRVISSRMRSSKLEAFGVKWEAQYTKDTADFIQTIQRKSGEKARIYGNPDMFQLLAKATSSNLTKSTKFMNTPSGCVIQVSTKEISPTGAISVGEAITFVPRINIDILKTQDGEIAKTEFCVLEEIKESVQNVDVQIESDQL